LRSWLQFLRRKCLEESQVALTTDCWEKQCQKDDSSSIRTVKRTVEHEIRDMKMCNIDCQNCIGSASTIAALLAVETGSSLRFSTQQNECLLSLHARLHAFVRSPRGPPILGTRTACSIIPIDNSPSPGVLVASPTMLSANERIALVFACQFGFTGSAQTSASNTEARAKQQLVPILPATLPTHSRPLGRRKKGWKLNPVSK
jgi:hypothetical protein